MRNLLVLLAISLLVSACDAAAQIIPDAKATPTGAVVGLSVLLWETCQEVP